LYVTVCDAENVTRFLTAPEGCATGVTDDR
jgi:hypothetical protein